MSSVTVRQATTTDNLDVVSVKRAAIRADGRDSYSADQVAAWAPDADELDNYEQALGDDTYHVLVAESAEEIVGFGVLNVETGALLALYIQPDQRGTGIGSRLLGQIETTAKLNGADTLDLLASRNAVSFYAEQGYELGETVERDIDGETLTFVAMETAL
jgi:putative acetyltransferase